MIEFALLSVKLSHQINQRYAHFRDPNSTKQSIKQMLKCLINNKTFPLRTKQCRIRFNSAFSSIRHLDLFLLIVIRTPLFALSLGHYTEYFLAVASFITRIVEDFDAWPRNEDKDLL